MRAHLVILCVLPVCSMPIVSCVFIIPLNAFSESSQESFDAGPVLESLGIGTPREPKHGYITGTHAPVPSWNPNEVRLCILHGQGYECPSNARFSCRFTLYIPPTSEHEYLEIQAISTCINLAGVSCSERIISRCRDGAGGAGTLEHGRHPAGGRRSGYPPLWRGKKSGSARSSLMR